ncbi:hypothetical protein Hanom_Chr16g01417141 [Helianthus anomalus]
MSDSLQSLHFLPPELNISESVAGTEHLHRKFYRRQEQHPPGRGGGLSVVCGEWRRLVGGLWRVEEARQWSVEVGGGGRRRRVEEKKRLCRPKKTWVNVCVVKRSRRPFLMKGLRENKQAADSKPLRASARRRHKWPEVLLAKKQTPP